MPPLQPPPLPPLPPPSAGCRHAGEPRHAGVVTFADVVEYLVRVCRPTVTDKTVLLASAVCVVVLAAAIAINASGGNSDTPLRLHDWVGDAFSRDVLFQSRQPCTIITPTELARSTVLAAGNRRYSLRHVGTNLCRALDQVGASAVPMLVFGPGYDRCVIATRIESKCTVLVNARIGEESDHVQASLLSIVFNLTHAVRTLPRQLTVSCTAWTEGQGVESAERLRLQDASAIVVAHWLQTGARGNYSDLS